MTKKFVRKTWSDHEIQRLVVLRDAGKTKSEFELEFGRNWSAISKQMSKLKIKYWQDATTGDYIIQKNVKEVCERYQNGERISSIIKDFPVRKHTILRHLRLHDVPVRPDHLTHAKKYKLNENYFDIIDSSEKAYFLGLLFADGSNDPIHHSIRLGLQDQDKHILYDFRKRLESDIPIRFKDYTTKYPTRKNAYIFDIYNKHLSGELNKIGMTKNKYFTCDFPVISPDLYSHFIRGYFDGDGSVYTTQPKKTYTPGFCFALAGNNLIIEKIQEILIKELGLSKVKLFTRHKAKKNTTRQLQYGGNQQCLKIREYLYKDATVYLKRKYNKFQKLNGSLVK